MKSHGRIYFVFENGIQQHKSLITYYAAQSLAKQLRGWGCYNVTIETIFGEIINF